PAYLFGVFYFVPIIAIELTIILGTYYSSGEWWLLLLQSLIIVPLGSVVISAFICRMGLLFIEKYVFSLWFSFEVYREHVVDSMLSSSILADEEWQPDIWW